MKKWEELSVDELPLLRKAYDDRFGEASVDIMEVGGPEALFNLMRQSLKTGVPIPDEYPPNLPDDAIVY